MSKTDKSGKLEFIALFFFLGLLAIGSLGEKLSTDIFTQIPVEKVDYKLTKAQDDSIAKPQTAFPKGFIEHHPVFEFTQDKLIASILIPGMFAIDDLVYCLLILTVCGIFLWRARYFDRNYPFSSKLVSGLKWTGIAFLGFGLLDWARLKYLNNYILNATDEIYRLETFSLTSRPLAIIGIIILWLHRLIKKAEKLQEEQALTV